MARTILTPDQLAKDATHFLKALQDEKPLPCVLLATAALEKALLSAVSQFFVQSKTAQALAGQFADRCTDLAYCLGLISLPVRENLKFISLIRNQFAHNHLFIDFDHPKVKELCGQLTYPRYAVLKEVDPEIDWPKKVAAPRKRFEYVCLHLFNVLLRTIRETSPCEERTDVI
jgi:hypothetical protein